MVLEESLLFDSAEGADAFIKYLRKKGCKAHKKTVATFSEREELEGTLDSLIAFLENLAERDAASRDDRSDGDDEWDLEEWEGDPDDEVDRAIVAASRRSRIEKLKKARTGLEKILGLNSEGDIVFSEADLARNREVYVEGMMQRAFPVLKAELEERGIDLPPREEGEAISEEEAGDAGSFLFVADLLEENGLVRGDDKGDFRLIRKIPAGVCRVKIVSESLGEIEEGDLQAHGISSCIHVAMECMHEVVMDGSIIVELSIEEVEDGLRGLDVEVQSLDDFFSRFELKRLAIVALLEVVGGSGRIPYSRLRDQLAGYRLESDEVSGPVRVTLHEDFLSALVAEMRKLGYLTGSQENIRLNK